MTGWIPTGRRAARDGMRRFGMSRPDPAISPGGGLWSRVRRAAAGTAGTAAATGTVWLALVTPGQYSVWGVQDFLRLPVAGIGVAAVGLVGSWRVARAVAAGSGAVLAGLVMLRGLNLGFRAVLTRPFDVTNDWTYLRDGAETLATFAGRAASVGAVAAASAVTAGVFTVVPWACVRLARAVARRPGRAGPVLAAVAVVWGALRASGVGWPHGYYTARAGSTAMLRMTRETVQVIPRNLADRAAFGRDIRSDPEALRPAAGRFAGLSGRDVVLVFLEGYGEVALDDPRVSDIVRPALAACQRDLAAAGFHARSAWTTSPTFGAGSWLAHSTVQAGLWVNTQRRYNQLLSTRRLTLSRMFRAAGWRCVFTMPSTDRIWPQGRPFYGYDMLYTKFNVGYRGQQYGYATMPDQYTYRAFARAELAPEHRRPVFAQIDTLSSHYPWTPPPTLVPWDEIGDGSTFTGPHPATAGAHRTYADAMAYTLQALTQFVCCAGDPNLVVIAVGDHQPNHTITRRRASHRTPIMLITADPAVATAAEPWGWDDGMTPGADAPVWRMDAIRDRLLTTFGGDRAEEGRPV